MEKTIVFEVRGMTCDNCVQHVTKAVREVPGVREVNVELAPGIARVEGAFDKKKVVEAIEEEGYEAALKG